MSANKVLLQVEGLVKDFPAGSGLLGRRGAAIRAVDGVSFEVRAGETLGLVGESGCGKSTLGRTVLQLYRPTAGKVTFDGIDLTKLSPGGLRQMRQRLQIIFQDPYSSLNPRMKVGDMIAEPLVVHKIGTAADRPARVRELLELVGLSPGFASRFPHEFSGGQRQRIGLARALASNPAFVVCDEPISSLDVSIQAQVVNLLKTLQKRLGLTYLFIAHDLSIIRYISDRVMVMYLGKVVEFAPRDPLFANPLHPYTQALMSAVPIPDPILERKRRRMILEGDLPNPAAPPPGCRFNTRCAYSEAICREAVPELRELAPNHWAACHFAERWLASVPAAARPA